MADKVENKPVAEKQRDGALSDFAFDLMKGAALGAAGGALGKKLGEAAADGIARGAGGGTKSANEAEKVGEAAGGAAAGAAGAGAGKAGKELGKEHKVEANQAQKVGGGAMQAFEGVVRQQVKDVLDTPKDVMDHVQKRPITAAVETVIGGPAAVILDAKLHKWFGDK